MLINLQCLSTQPGRRTCSRPSFTLVELMVAITIMGILAGMVLYTLAGAQRDASVARTQGTLKKINEIILYRWEEFRYRAVKVNIPDDYLSRIPLGPQLGQVPVSPREGARLRLMILRDTMRMELPDNYRDIEYSPSLYHAAVFTSSGTPSVISPPISRNVPGEYNNLRRAFGLPPVMTPYTAAVSAGMTVAKASTDNPAFDSAELLYQIVAASNYNGSNGLEYFRPTEIGDVDGDGFLEFIDAWGMPICFIRWPAGYGEPNRTAGGDPRPADSFLNDTSVPDALDPLKTDWRYNTSTPPWLLIPLIVSAGPDGEFNLVFDSGVNYATTTAVGVPGSSPYPNPYYFPDPYASSSGKQQGKIVDTALTTDADNLTNYDLLVQ